ncbi:MAG TPA: MXAN_5187 C-terminal domain-containing protein [Anaeromyxobacteraceae bacterium]|nr:MXAN_5187 C-terminal domain-containing protein [Anaeromyxobacteraceae bacterium]
MNRLKLWLYALVVLSAVAGLALYASTDLVARAAAGMDADLRAAADRAGSAQRLMSAEAAALVQLAARDEGFERLAGEAAERAAPSRGRKKPPTPTAAQRAARQAAFEKTAQSALRGAARSLGVALPEGFGFAAANREGIAERVREGKGRAERETAAFLREVAAGRLRRAVLRVDETLWLVVGAPAADGSAIALYLPFDDAWAKALAGATGVEVVLQAEQARHVGTLSGTEAVPVAAAATRATGVVGVGSLPRIVPAIVLPVKLPALPLLAAKAPARRALAVPVEGADKASVILSVPAAPRLEPAVRLQWLALAGIAAALLLALPFALWIRAEAPVQVPEALVTAAQRIESGDMSARAPSLAGRLGTIASALNAAAEAAGRAAAAMTETLGAAYSAPETSASAFEFPLRAPPQPPTPAVSTTSKLDGGGGLGAFEAAPVPAPRPAPAPAFAPAPRAPAPAPRATAPPPRGEEAEWEEVFQDFLRVRAECGEPAEGLTYEKFRVKLERNKEQLVQKYGCRTVRFQVYVKEGRAALKATPVR